MNKLLNEEIMKKIVVSLIIIFAFSVNTLYAEGSYWFDQQKSSETKMLKQDQTEQQTITSGSSFFSDEPVLKVKPPTTGGGDPNPSSPVREGSMILGLLVCIYSIIKNRQKKYFNIQN